MPANTHSPKQSSPSLFAIATAIVFAAPVFGCLAQTNSASQVVVRPCNNSEWQLAFSDEVKQLTRKQLEYTGGFSSCEAAVIPFLEHARILRLHTPVWVDYSYTAAVMQSSREGPWRLVSSGRGMVAKPQPASTDSTAALNFILAEANLKPDKATIKTISDLYFFILDSEGGVFGIPIAKRQHQLNKYAYKTNVRIDRDSAVASYPGNPWQLTFKFRQGSILLASVVGTDQ